jgi:hypothetical protein
MKWKIREGFNLFNSPGDAIDYRLGNRAIKPLAKGGDIVTLRPNMLEEIRQLDLLGKLEPMDDEAVRYFGNTKPIISRLVTDPVAFAYPAPEKAA